jgi:hypothetical protein
MKPSALCHQAPAVEESDYCATRRDKMADAFVLFLDTFAEEILERRAQTAAPTRMQT